MHVLFTAQTTVSQFASQS